MWNMAVNNISYPIYPLSTRTEEGYITKMIPFFFCSVYLTYKQNTLVVENVQKYIGMTEIRTQAGPKRSVRFPYMGR